MSDPTFKIQSIAVSPELWAETCKRLRKLDAENTKLRAVAEAARVVVRTHACYYELIMALAALED